MFPNADDRAEVTAPSCDRAVFTFDGAEVSVREIILAAFLRGELDPLWRETLAGITALEQATRQELEPEEAAIQNACDEFRYARDLVAAEDTERWLAARGLTLDAFGDFFVRAYWRGRLGRDLELTATTYAAAGEEEHEFLRVDVWLSNAMEALARGHAWRLAAAASVETPPPEATQPIRQKWSSQIEAAAPLAARGPGHPTDLHGWLDRLIVAEAAFARCREEALTEENRRQTLGRLRPALLRLDCGIMDLESEDAAREALLCVRDDRISMETLAREARYPFERRLIALAEVPQVASEFMLSVPPGTVLEPWPRGEGFQLCRICGRVEPNLADPAVRAQVDGEILAHHFGELAQPHLHWLIGWPASL